VLTVVKLRDKPQLALILVANDIRFQDLTPIFQEESCTGAELYDLFHTHWNRPGRDLAAASIHNYIEEVLQDPSGYTSVH